MIRKGKTERLDFEPAERLLKDAYPLRTFPNVRLYQRAELLPTFELPDVNGNQRSVVFKGKWTVLRVGSLQCDTRDLDAFNEIAKTSGLQILAISEYEEAHNLQKLMADNGYDFPLLLGGGRPNDVRDDDFANRTLPGAGVPTYVLIAPNEQVMFMASGSGALKSAWSRYKSLVFR